MISAGAGAAESSAAGGAAKKAGAPLTGAQNSLYSQAESIAGTPYTPYTGQRVADLSGNQQQAVQQAAQSSGPGSAAQQYIDKAGQQADYIAGNTWNSSTASKYMNPYTQNVTDLALNKENQAYATQLNANNAAATSSGAFGGDRATLTNNNTTQGHLYNQGALEAEGQANAYNSAVQAWQADNARAASAATSYQNSGNDISNMNQSQIQNLLATGGAAQAVQQMKFDTGYNNYLDQRSWAQNQLAPLESAVGRTPTLAPVMPANYAGSLIGAGSALAGYFGKNNTNTNTPTDFASLDGQYNNQANADVNAGDYGTYSGVDPNSLSMSQSGADIGGGTTTYFGDSTPDGF